MIVQGDAGHIPLPDNSVGAVICDPPYGLGAVKDIKALLLAWINGEHDNQQSNGFMGRDWDKVPSPKIWKEILRVMKPGAYILAFAGCRTVDLMGVSMRLAGFEDNNLLAFVFGSGFPKATDLSKQLDRRTGVKGEEYIREDFAKKSNKKPQRKSQVICGQKGVYNKHVTPEAKQWDGWKYGKQMIKPALEPILLMQKPFEKGMTGAENVLKWGVGAVNVDGSRIGCNNNNSPGKRIFKQGKKTNSGFAGDMKHGHWEERITPRPDYEADTQGRFPSNLLLQHHPECEFLGHKETKGNGHFPKYMNDRDTGFLKGTKAKENEEYYFKKELTENWRCHKDCPIKIMNEQSGILKSGELKQYLHPTTNPIYGTYNHTNLKHFNKSEGGASRFFYCSKSPARERWFYCKVCQGVFPGNEKEQHMAHAMRCIDCGVDFNPREENAKSGIERMNQSNQMHEFRPNTYTKSVEDKHKGHKTESNFIQHPTQKPEKLIREYLIKLITPPGEIVLDPFGGSGTTAVACRDMGVNCICIDRDKYYCLIAKARESGEYLIKELVTSVNKNNGNGKAVQLEIFEGCI